jgi:hypothetical protein
VIAESQGSPLPYGLMGLAAPNNGARCCQQMCGPLQPQAMESLAEFESSTRCSEAIQPAYFLPILKLNYSPLPTPILASKPLFSALLHNAISAKLVPAFRSRIIIPGNILFRRRLGPCPVLIACSQRLHSSPALSPALHRYLQPCFRSSPRRAFAILT